MSIRLDRGVKSGRFSEFIQRFSDDLDLRSAEICSVIDSVASWMKILENLAQSYPVII